MAQVYRDNHATLSEILDEAGANGATLLIPDLQRPYVWSPRQVIVLVDSLLRGWPFGSLLLWSVTQEQAAKMPRRPFARLIDRINDDSDEVSPRQEPAKYRMVLDGQQRVQSLLLAFGGDSWGFKLLDREWHESLREKRQRGRASAHWSVGELCLDIDVLRLELETKGKKLAAVDFTGGALTWAVRHSATQRSPQRSANYDYPLYATDQLPGRFLRLSRLWELAGDKGLSDSADFEDAIEKLLSEHGAAALARPVKRGLEDIARNLRDVRGTRVTFLEVNAYDPNMGDEARYMDAVVSIFTRLNTAGRTLSREEITFAWVKNGWRSEMVGNRSASQCFKQLGDELKVQGIDLSLDDLMAGVAHCWSVVFNLGKVLTQRDLLDATAIRPMAEQLSEAWTDLQESILKTAEALQARGLMFERHYHSLNALAVLWAWQFVADRWLRRAAPSTTEHDAWQKQISVAFGPLAERWLICSQWAGYWGASSSAKVSECASKLATLRTDSETISGAIDALATLINGLTNLTRGTEDGAADYIDRLRVDGREQVRQYYTPLWIWHRLDATRWSHSIPLRIDAKKASHDVDHVVAVKLWEGLPAAGARTVDDGDLVETVNEIGNCLLLETGFNISKGKTPLGDWLARVHEFQNGTLDQNSWSASMTIPSVMRDPRRATQQAVSNAVDERTRAMKLELKDFVSGKLRRRDVV